MRALIAIRNSSDFNSRRSEWSSFRQYKKK
jgi:hypothetical protein